MRDQRHKARHAWRGIGITVFSFFIVWASSGCAGGCEGLEPLPAELPPKQTIEGGLQVRITEGGLEALTTEIPGLVHQALQNFAVPPTTIFDNMLGSLTLCPSGCLVNITMPPNSVSVSVTDHDTLTLGVSLIASTNLVLMLDPLIGSTMSCTFALSTDPEQPLHVDADIGFYIRNSDGELRIEVKGIRNVSVAGMQFGVQDCGILTDVLDFFAGVLTGLMNWLDMLISNPITEWLTNQLILPWLQPYIDSLIPSMGISGMIDVGAMLSEFSPGTTGKLETRMVAGGYVNLFNKGMSLGVITGLNSDADPETRSAVPNQFGVLAHSENAKCVPPFQTFDLSPYVVVGEMHEVAGRNTYGLGAELALNGTSDTSQLVYSTGHLAGHVADVAIGVSEHFLNLAGFHAVNSGALCVTVGTAQMEMLTVGMFGLLVESLVGLTNNNRRDAPIRMMVRPQWPAQFAIGAGTDDDPLLELYLRDFRVDLYPFVEERYTLALTLALDMRVGMNMESYVNDEGRLVAAPTLLGVDEENVTVRIHNSKLVAEDPAELEATLPQILGIIMPLLTSVLGEGFVMPELENGLSLSSLEFKPNAANTMMLVLASIKPSVQPLPPLPVRTRAEIVGVNTPPPDTIRGGIMSGNPDHLPSVTVDVGVMNPEPGAQYEWQYRFGRMGLWSPFTSESRLVLRDRALSFQGRHTLYLRARRKGVPLSQDRNPVRLDLLIDSMAPSVDVEFDTMKVRFVGFDLVTAREDLVYSFCRGPGDWSPYASTDFLWIRDAMFYAGRCGGKLGVRVMDEAGNEGEHWFETSLWMNSDPVEATPAKTKRGCSAAGTSGGFFSLFLIFFALLLSAGRKWKKSMGHGKSLVCLLAAGAVLFSACSKKSPGGENGFTFCEDDEECLHMSCPDGQVPTCRFGRCECVDDVLFGRLGMYSSLAVAAGPQAYVAAYNRTYGDLMVARFHPPGVVPNQPYIPGENHGWEFVDGVPDGPVMVPNSDVRGGIRTRGENVGTYTAIGLNSSRHPVVAYHDETHGSLKFAWFDGNVWHKHVVDYGGSDDPKEGRAGLYNSMVVRRGTNAPGIAYMAPLVKPVEPGQPVYSELRFAQAKKENPSSWDDWIVHVVDRVVVPDPGNLPEVYDWEYGVGVHPSVALKSDGAPVIAYYDAVRGNLMMSEMLFDGEGLSYFSEPVVVDGEDGEGRDTGNVGLFSSVAVDPVYADTYHFSYTDPHLNGLYYFSTLEGSRVVVDDGYRLEENKETGLPMPVFHKVGWDSKLIMTGGGNAMIFYQDSTTHELKLARRADYDSDWTFQVIAGGRDPFKGAYGFYTSLYVDGTRAFVSSFVINEHAEPDLLGGSPVKYYVEIFEFSLGPG